MSEDDRPATGAEAREAELLRDALEGRTGPGKDPAPVDDALAAAWLLRAAPGAELRELRARALLERVWPRPSWRLWARAAAAAAAVLVTVAAFVAGRPRAPSALPPPPSELLRAQLEAARPGAQADLARLDGGMAAYREQVFEALRRASGGAR